MVFAGRIAMRTNKVLKIKQVFVNQLVFLSASCTKPKVVFAKVKFTYKNRASRMAGICCLARVLGLTHARLQSQSLTFSIGLEVIIDSICLVGQNLNHVEIKLLNRWTLVFHPLRQDQLSHTLNWRLQSEARQNNPKLHPLTANQPNGKT